MRLITRRQHIIEWHAKQLWWLAWVRRNGGGDRSSEIAELNAIDPATHDEEDYIKRFDAAMICNECKCTVSLLVQLASAFGPVPHESDDAYICGECLMKAILLLPQPSGKVSTEGLIAG